VTEKESRFVTKFVIIKIERVISKLCHVTLKLSINAVLLENLPVAEPLSTINAFNP
jgi:hypothetical protein